jgi:hypothetical protein
VIDRIRSRAGVTSGVAMLAAVVAAAGLYMRLESIGKSLWIDEFGTFWVVQDSFATMISRSLQFQGQTPLYYATAWVSLALAGESEWALRLPSLLAGVGFVVLSYAAGTQAGGRDAGWWAAGLAWLTLPSVASSVDARPYALVLMAIAATCASFAWTVRTGSAVARAALIVSGASVAWVHYVQFPVVMGFYLGCLFYPALRERYPLRRMGTDAVVQGALVALCLPQILALLSRRDSLSWLDGRNYFVFLSPIVTLAPILAIGFVAARPGQRERIGDAVARCLWLALLSHVVTLQVAALLGVNLLSPRYFIALLPPAVVLAGLSLSRLRRGEVVAALLGFVVLTGGGAISTKRALGSVTGIGYDDWRGAVSDLTTRLRDDPHAVVLYRSGFVEEDALPLGQPTPATLAPLRSPGRTPFPASVRSLTFRWSHPQRANYFDEQITPLIAGSSRFHFLTGSWVFSGPSYQDEFVAWLERTWPEAYEVHRYPHGGVELLEFRRRSSSSSP